MYIPYIYIYTCLHNYVYLSVIYVFPSLKRCTNQDPYSQPFAAFIQQTNQALHSPGAPPTPPSPPPPLLHTSFPTSFFLSFIATSNHWSASLLSFLIRNQHTQTQILLHSVLSSNYYYYYYYINYYDNYHYITTTMIITT